MAATLTTEKLIQSANTRVFRRAFVKRRLTSDGLFESEFQDITNDVKRWGSIRQTADVARFNEFRFSALKMVVANDTGKFNPEDEQNSLWFGFASQQRSLFRIEAGFVHQTLGADGIWVNTEFPLKSVYDIARYDEADKYDTGNVIFEGVLTGDLNRSDKNEIPLNIMPKLQVFKDYAARNIDGYTSTGLTASEFMEKVRDHTDGSGAFIFRPFFGDTITEWLITTTTTNYTQLDTSTADFVRDNSVWEVMKRLAQAEVFVPYINNQGQFVFASRDATATVDFQFFGTGFVPDREFGHTIKGISSFGKAISKYFSRVQVQFDEGNTFTSIEVIESTLSVSNANVTWLNGEKTLKVVNTWIPNTTTAQSIAQSVFNEVSAIRNELAFTTTFVPQLNIFSRFKVFYDSADVNRESLWDLNNWSNDAGTTDNALEWDKSAGESIFINGVEYKALSFTINLDRFETKFVAREV